jgi:hypothetical protein
MMAVRFPSESCPTWEPFNLISKDKKEGQMLSFLCSPAFYHNAEHVGMHTHTQFTLIMKKMQSVKDLYLLHVRDRCSLLFLILLVSAASLKNSEMENTMLRGYGPEVQIRTCQLQ